MQATNPIAVLTQGLLGEFDGHLDRALELDPWQDAGGPQIARARLLYEVPWPKRDLERSAELLERVVAEHPENLRAWLFLAETQKALGKAIVIGEEARPLPVVMHRVTVADMDPSP